MPKTRLVFMGSPAFATVCLAALIEPQHPWEVVGVICQPDKPSGRGRVLSACSVKNFADTRNIPTLQPHAMRSPEMLQQFAQWAPDIAVVAAFGRLLPTSWLRLPHHGCVNVHASLLPRFRGASPITQAILEGDSHTGVCIMQMDEGMDTGSVFAKQAMPIAQDATCGTLTAELSALGATLLVQTLPGILSGSIQPVPQAQQGITYAPLLKKEQGLLDVRLHATYLERQLRAFDPWPGVYLEYHKGRMGVLAARVMHVDTANAKPGCVIAADNSGVIVACGDKSALLLETVRPANRAAMSAAAWVMGRGIQIGDFFYLPSAIEKNFKS